MIKCSYTGNHEKVRIGNGEYACRHCGIPMNDEGRIIPIKIGTRVKEKLMKVKSRFRPKRKG